MQEMFQGIDNGTFEDPDFKEDAVRELILVPIFSRLGYLASGPDRLIRSKTLHHPFIRVGTRDHAVKTIPDYTLLHADTPILVLDAKGPNEDIFAKKHLQQTYSYAIHPEIKCREFGLCNGRELAVFNIENEAPILHVRFSEYSTRWEEIEKTLSPTYILKPELRRFAPDFGLRLRRLGLTESHVITMLGVRLNLFARVDDELMTANANTNDGSGELCASFDFPREILPAMLAGLPQPLAADFAAALARAPFKASAGLAIELDLDIKLGQVIELEHETFVPLLVERVLDSRFITDELSEGGSDIPQEIYQLRNAFVVERTAKDREQ